MHLHLREKRLYNRIKIMGWYAQNKFAHFCELKIFKA